MKKDTIIGLAMCAVMAATPLTALAAENESILTVPEPAADEMIVGVPQITVNGEAIDFSKSNLSQYIFATNGNTMVPLRAVAEKMGFTVGWDGENKAVTVGDDDWEVRAYIGEDLYSGVTKIEGAVGAAAPQSYGTAPQLFEDTTFVPAKMFELMEYKYHSVGQFVDFTKANTIIDEMGQEYSNDTLIISVAANAVEDDIINLFKSNGLDIINRMDNLKMYTVKLKSPMTADALDTFIAELEKNENILAANKNYIMHIDETVQIPNPFVPYENIDAVKKVLSFNPSVPLYVPTGYEIDEITAIEDDFLQIIYNNDKDERICYRTAKSNEDISGDYNDYTDIETVTINNNNVTVKGDNNLYHNASWFTEDEAFSVYSDNGIEKNIMIDIVKSVD